MSHLPFRWPGQRVLVTGGSAGVGLALARTLRARGARVAICGRDADRLDAARRVLGADVVTLVADVGDPAARAPLVEAAAAALGGLSVLVNNAGIQHVGRLAARPAHDVVADDARELAINLHAPIALALHALPHLRAAAARDGAAAIVNVTSGLALVPKASAPTYCASKAALRSWTIAARWQFAADAPGVRVHEAILPLVDTEMTRGRGRNKRPPADVAEAIADGVARGREELRIGPVALLVPLLRLAPSVAYRLMRDS